MEHQLTSKQINNSKRSTTVEIKNGSPITKPDL